MTTTEISLNLEPAERTSDAVQVEQTISTSESELIARNNELRKDLQALRVIHFEDGMTIDNLKHRLEEAKRNIEDRDDLIMRLKARLYDLIVAEDK